MESSAQHGCTGSVAWIPFKETVNYVVIDKYDGVDISENRNQNVITNSMREKLKMELLTCYDYIKNSSQFKHEYHYIQSHMKTAHCFKIFLICLTVFLSTLTIIYCVYLINLINNNSINLSLMTCIIFGWIIWLLITIGYLKYSFQFTKLSKMYHKLVIKHINNTLIPSLNNKYLKYVFSVEYPIYLSKNKNQNKNKNNYYCRCDNFQNSNLVGGKLIILRKEKSLRIKDIHQRLESPNASKLRIMIQVSNTLSESENHSTQEEEAQEDDDDNVNGNHTSSDNNNNINTNNLNKRHISSFDSTTTSIMLANSPDVEREIQIDSNGNYQQTLVVFKNDV